MSRNIQTTEDEAVRIARQGAFTLLEILVALSMIGLILAAVYGSYTAATTAVIHCKPKSLLEQQARLLLQRMSCELRCCYPGRPDESAKSPSEPPPGDEIIEHERMPLFAGEEMSSNRTFLQFVTWIVTSKQNHSVGGLVRVSYRLDKAGTTLLRGERRHVRGFENDDNDDNWLPILSNVDAIALEYYDGEKWLEKWDSNDMNGLPLAVRTSLVLQTEDAGSFSFMSCAHIACRGYQIPVGTVQKAMAYNGDSL